MAKIDRNRERDREVMAKLGEQGWRRLTIWECSMRGKGKITIDEVIRQTIEWLEGSEVELEIQGNHPSR